MHTQKIVHWKTGKSPLLVWVLILSACTGLFAQINKVSFEGKYRDVIIPDPAPAAYIILTAVGGDGGRIKRDNTYRGGRGALVRAIFSVGTQPGQLAPGGTLRFMVGGCGDSDSDMSNADMKGVGGGGGTGIAYRSPAGKWTLLVVAGGGGGANWASPGSCRDGGPGHAYVKAEIGNGGPSGFEGGADDYNSGAGAFYSTPTSGTDKMRSHAGWPDGPGNGEPTGGSAHDEGKVYYYSGGWGFGAGGIGQRGSRETGGGGGYTGGESGGTCQESTCYRLGTNDHRFGKYDYMPSYGGTSYVNENDLVVNGILTFERGHTDDPEAGYAFYEFRKPARLYDFIQLDKDKSKCIEDYGAETNNGTNVRLSDCVDKAQQQWYFYENRSILFAKDAGKCLDLDHSNLANGTNIQLWDCDNTDAQRWVYDGTTQQIRSGINFTKCLDLRDGHPVNWEDMADVQSIDGANVQLWDCQTIGSQQWFLERATTVSLADTFNRIHSALDLQKCIDVQKASTANGANIQLYHCHHASSQYWHFDGNTIRYFADQTKCLDLSNSNIDNGTNIQLFDCNGTDAQRWVYDGMTRSFRSFVHGAKCIDVSGSSTEDNTNIQLYDCNGTDAQQFVISN